MNKIILIVIILGIYNCSELEMSSADFAGIDYLPATEAFTKVKGIQSEYEFFRQKIQKKYEIVIIGNIH